jgi:hypothetical protein
MHDRSNRGLSRFSEARICACQKRRGRFFDQRLGTKIASKLADARHDLIMKFGVDCGDRRVGLLLPQIGPQGQARLARHIQIDQGGFDLVRAHVSSWTTGWAPRTTPTPLPTLY